MMIHLAAPKMRLKLSLICFFPSPRTRFPPVHSCSTHAVTDVVHVAIGWVLSGGRGFPVVLVTGGSRIRPSRRIANLLILESTPTLLEVFLRGYAENPQGYTAPELVSMWSSILNQEGVSVCSRYVWTSLGLGVDFNDLRSVIGV